MTVIESSATSGRTGVTARAIAAAICVLLALTLFTPAAIAYWANRTLTDTQRYVNTVGPLVESTAVQDVIANKVIAAIEGQVDVEAVVREVFGDVIKDAPRLQALVGPLAGAINGLIEREVREFIASDAFADAWIAANTRAQQALVRLLEGDDSGALSLQEDQVVLDVSGVIEQVKQRLVERGLTMVENLPIPEVDKQIVLVEAPRLEQARTIYAFANPVAQWMIVVVAALFLAALLLSRRRARMTVIIGGTLIANALLVALALSIARQLFINGFAGTEFSPASSVFYDQLLSYLERGSHMFLGLGLILVLVGWFCGSNRSGTTVRTGLSGSLQNAGASLVGVPGVSTTGRWVAPNIKWLRVAVGVLGVVVLMWGNEISVHRLLWAAGLTFAVIAALEVLVGAGTVADDDDAVPDNLVTSTSNRS